MMQWSGTAKIDFEFTQHGGTLEDVKEHIENLLLTTISSRQDDLEIVWSHVSECTPKRKEDVE